jgi:hypothetical protein
MYVSSATPPKERLLGAMNGLAQTVVAVQRTVGPVAADSLFAFSVSKNVLGGNFVYVILLFMVCVALSISVQLPRHIWTHGGR